MNAKEAKAIINFVEDDEGMPRLDNLSREPRYVYAKGFMEAVEKFKPVVEALEIISKHNGWKCKDEAICALESYRRDVLGEE